jgi:hypothetical protein
MSQLITPHWFPLSGVCEHVPPTQTDVTHATSIPTGVGQSECARHCGVPDALEDGGVLLDGAAEDAEDAEADVPAALLEDGGNALLLKELAEVADEKDGTDEEVKELDARCDCEEETAALEDTRLDDDEETVPPEEELEDATASWQAPSRHAWPAVQSSSDEQRAAGRSAVQPVSTVRTRRETVVRSAMHAL